MDQRISSEGNIAVGYVISICAVLMLPLAIGLLVSYPSELWWLGLVLLGCFGMTLYGGVKMIRKSSVRLKATDQQILMIKKKVMEDHRDAKIIPVTADEKDSSDVILVHWTYTNDEWKRFYQWKMRERKLNNIILAILIAIFGTFILKFLKGADWGQAMIISALAGIAYGFISYRLALASIGSSVASQYNQVIITPESILINNKLNFFKDEERWISDVKILEENDPKVLEINYAWQTRRGNTTDQLHIPIPKGKLGEAVMLMDRLNNVKYKM